MLELINISFSYPEQESKTQKLIDDISFKVNECDFISLMGPNGCGKSTILKLICNLLKPDKGKIILDEVLISDYTPKKLSQKIAYVPQSTNSVFPYSIFEIVAMGRNPYHSILGFETKNDFEIINESLEMMELDKLSHKSINEVSGGEAQRTFIARALAQQPNLLILDEPNSHLDLKHQIGIFEILQKLNQQNKLTILLVSHDINHALTYSKRGILLKDGHIVCNDEIHNVLSTKNINSTFGIKSELLTSEDGNYKSLVIKSGNDSSIKDDR
jgi:iron complex transport system ATP-binding protein